MNKLVLLVCLFLIPLTLASETQRRFKVYVNVLKAVADDDPHVGETLANHIKRELLSLEDVDLVRADQYWDFMLEIIYLQHKITDGRNTGGSHSQRDIINGYRTTILSQIAYAT